MALTQTARNACDVKVYLDNDAGQLVDISGSSNECSMDLTNELGVLHTFGSRFPVRGECKSDATIRLRFVYTTDDGEALEIFKRWYFTTRGQKSLQIDVPDSNPGGDRYQFEVFLESLNVPLVSTDPNPILCEAVLRPTGTYTFSVIAS